MRLTYETFAHDDDDDDIVQGLDTEPPEIGRSPGRDNHTRSHWDDDCPWNEWYSAEDPLKGVFEWLTCCFTFSLLLKGADLFRLCYCTNGQCGKMALEIEG